MCRTSTTRMHCTAQRGTADAIGCVVKAPFTLGTFLRSFQWGHVRHWIG